MYIYIMYTHINLLCLGIECVWSFAKLFRWVDNSCEEFLTHPFLYARMGKF